MRTTIDLPEDLHRRAKAIAYERDWTMSQAVAWLMRRGLEEAGPSPVIEHSSRTGLPIVRLGRTVTSEEVKNVLEEDD